MQRYFSWFVLGVVLLLILDGCQAGPRSSTSHAWSDFRRNIVESIESPDSTRWVSRPDVYGSDDPMRAPKGLTSRKR
jgi:hypothetical protein